MHFGARQVVVGGQELHPAGVEDRVGRLHPVEEDVVEGRGALLGLETEGEGEAGLGVEVDEQHPFAEVGEGEPQGLGRRGLADAALLVGDREHPRHAAESTSGPGQRPQRPRMFARRPRWAT